MPMPITIIKHNIDITKKTTMISTPTLIFQIAVTVRTEERLTSQKKKKKI
jgi:hypothetical protein